VRLSTHLRGKSYQWRDPQVPRSRSLVGSSPSLSCRFPRYSAAHWGTGRIVVNRGSHIRVHFVFEHSRSSAIQAYTRSVVLVADGARYLRLVSIQWLAGGVGSLARDRIVPPFANSSFNLDSRSTVLLRFACTRRSYTARDNAIPPPQPCPPEPRTLTQCSWFSPLEDI